VVIVMVVRFSVMEKVPGEARETELLDLCRRSSWTRVTLRTSWRTTKNTGVYSRPASL